MLIHNVEIDGERASLRISGGLIAEIDRQPDMSRMPGEGTIADGPIIDGGGAALLPGLHDHHIHLNASAAAMQSVQCGPANITNAAELIAALSNASKGDWIRGIGYHPSVAGDIDRDWLDQNGPDRPIRIQHRGGRMWIFNSRAMALLDMKIPDNGQLVDGDKRLRVITGTQRPDLIGLISRLHSYGITGVTEVTPGNDRADFEQYTAAAGALNLTIMGGRDLHGAAGKAHARIGPLKIHNHDHDLPSLADLTHTIVDAHDHNRAVAIHCVTRAEMMLSLAALEDAGGHPHDRIEHAAIADEAMIEKLVQLELTVVTQPHFIVERQAAYLKEVAGYERPHLWRLQSFLDAGIALAGGSDSPFGGMDPWHAMACATKRPAMLASQESLCAEEALGLFTKPAANAGAPSRQIKVGAAADLCLLDRTWDQAVCDFSKVNVRATWVRGDLVYETISSINPQL